MKDWRIDDLRSGKLMSLSTTTTSPFSFSERKFENQDRLGLYKKNSELCN